MPYGFDRLERFLNGWPNPRPAAHTLALKRKKPDLIAESNRSHAVRHHRRRALCLNGVRIGRTLHRRSRPRACNRSLACHDRPARHAMRGKQNGHPLARLSTGLCPNRPQPLRKGLRQRRTLRPSSDKLHFDASRGRQQRPPVQAYAGSRVLRCEANRFDVRHAVHPQLRNHVRNIRMPVAHPHIHFCATQCLLQQTTLRHRPLRQRRSLHTRSLPQPNLCISVLQFLHNLLGQRPSPRHLAQILRHLTQHIRRPMREQQHSALPHLQTSSLSAHGRLSSFTHSTTRITLCTGVPGTMPCPTLKMCPGRPAAASSTARTRSFNTSSGANSEIGSRFPCTAQPAPTAFQPTSSGTLQSSPITSAPVSLIAGSREAVSTPK